MPTQQSTPKGSSRKVGTKRMKCSAYTARGNLLKNKLKRIMQSNGMVAVASYKHDIHARFPSENKDKK